MLDTISNNTSTPEVARENATSSLKSSTIQTSNISLARAAGWPDGMLVPLIRADDTAWDASQRGKAPGQPKIPGERPARGLQGWQNGVAVDTLEAAGRSDFNFGVLCGFPVNGEQVLAVDVDTELSPGAGVESPPTEAEYLKVAHEVCAIVRDSLEAVTTYVEWCRETRAGRAAFLLRVPATVSLGKKTQTHISRNGVYYGKIELLNEGCQLASVGTYARTMKPIAWHCQGETVRIPDYQDLSVLDTQEAVEGLIARIRSDLAAEGFAWSPKAPRAPKAERSKRIETNGATPKGMRSDVAHDVVMEAGADGADREEAAKALSESPDSGMREWLEENGGREGRQFTRLWQRGRALQIAIAILDEHKLTLDESEMYAKAVLAWCVDVDAYRWYADRGISGKDDSEARAFFGWVMKTYGRVEAQDDFAPLEGPHKAPAETAAPIPAEDEFEPLERPAVPSPGDTSTGALEATTALSKAEGIDFVMLSAEVQRQQEEAYQRQRALDFERYRRRATPMPTLDDIEPRRWLYGTELLLDFVSVLGAPGGVGKTAYSMLVALSVATGKSLLHKGAGPIPPEMKVHERGRVWLCNLEDPLSEIKRRLKAALTHHDVTYGEVKNWVFTDSGRDSPFIVANRDKESGTVVMTPLVPELVVELRARDIKLLVVDPFVDCHELSENDNGEINFVMKLWARVATEANCAVHLVHHFKKGGASGDAEAFRGGSAIIGAARSALTIGRMSTEEAKRLGVEESKRWRHLRVDDAKANMSPPAEKARWLKLISVDLANGDPRHPDGDNVHTLEAWEPPTPDSISMEETREILTAIDAGLPNGEPYTLRPNARDRWAGSCVMDATGCEEDHVKRVLSMWRKENFLREDNYTNKDSKTRKCVRVNWNVVDAFDGTFGPII